MPVLQGRGELVSPMNPAAIDHHHDLFISFAEGGHYLMDILAKILAVKMGHDFIEEAGGPILYGANHMEQHASGDATPGALAHPDPTFAAFLAFDLAPAQGVCGQAKALGAAPPAQPGKGKTPEDGFVFIEQDDLTSTCLVLEGGEFERAIGEISRGGIEPASGTAVAQRVFLKRQRTLSRPSWTPVSRAKTVASSRQLHCEWRDPCSKGS